MGAPRDYAGEGKDPHWAAPLEPREAGCPGAWYRTPFLASLLRYTRDRDEMGGRVANLELCATADPLVREAVRALEDFEDAALAAHREADRKLREGSR